VETVKVKKASHASHGEKVVSVSRGQWDAQIFTNDREKLPQALGHDVSQPERA
jgi:hypothetical protein